MAVKIRLARAGSKKRPTYRIVIANATAPRDGDFIEKVGTYSPLLAHDDVNRITLKADRVAYWLSVGARPTDRVASFIAKHNVILPISVTKKMEIKLQNRKAKLPKNPTKFRKNQPKLDIS
jgi:small subunit ribosomal protein S16